MMDIAVLGATGEVGKTLLEVLEERDFPVGRLYPLASSRSAGQMVSFASEEVEVLDAAEFDFSQVQLAFFTAGSEASAHYAPLALEAGASVVDNTSHFRMQPDTPLVVPEVNPQALDGLGWPLLASCPNCSTIQLVVALCPLARKLGLKRVDVVTFQAVSGAGHRAVEELSRHTRMLLSGEEPEPDVFERSVAFNILPRIGNFDQAGYTGEENKMVAETRKILELPKLVVNPTCVRVPVFYGHSEAVRAEFSRPVSADEVRQLLVEAEGLEVMDDPGYLSFPTPRENGAGLDKVLVGRIRAADPDCEDSPGQAVNMWVVADNVRKGAAVNSVQIAELLCRQIPGSPAA